MYVKQVCGVGLGYKHLITVRYCILYKKGHMHIKTQVSLDLPVYDNFSGGWIEKYRQLAHLP